MHRLTGGRFTLGLGRGIEPLFDAFGLPRITTAQIEDFVGLMRRLWHGEVVFGHDGPAGSYPVLHLDSSFDEDIPIGLAAFGPNSLALAGRAARHGRAPHVLHRRDHRPRRATTVRRAAEEAGRDPAAVRVWSCFATVGDHLPDDVRLKKTVGRLATYLQGYGDLMVRDQPVGSGGARAVPGRRGRRSRSAGPSTRSPHRPARAHRHAAARRVARAGGPGSAEALRRRACSRQFDLGVDGVIMHGASPAELAPVVDAYRARRPAERFAGLAANPGA